MTESHLCAGRGTGWGGRGGCVDPGGWSLAGGVQGPPNGRSAPGGEIVESRLGAVPMGDQGECQAKGSLDQLKGALREFGELYANSIVGSNDGVWPQPRFPPAVEA